ncbi:MAG: hypothetical protein R3B97_06910 [Dehalococcoidia bacterium]
MAMLHCTGRSHDLAAFSGIAAGRARSVFVSLAVRLCSRITTRSVPTRFVKRAPRPRTGSAPMLPYSNNRLADSSPTFLLLTA